MAAKIRLTITEIQGTGHCGYGHKVGQSFRFPEDINKICPWAFYTLFPAITALQYGARFPWETDPDRTWLCCPDPKNEVVFEIAKVGEEQDV